MAVAESMDGEDAPALVPAPPDLVPLDTSKVFEDVEPEEAEGKVTNMMNLLRIAIYNISYIRGIFPEEYFRDNSVPELEMTIKKLIPKDVESRRLIDWIDQGVNDAMEKKYLETVHFCICEKDKGATIEDYSFTFRYPNARGEEVLMEFCLEGSKGNSVMFKSNHVESTGNQIRNLIRETLRQ